MSDEQTATPPPEFGQQAPSEGLTSVGDIYPFKAADTPYPLPEDAPETPPWEKAEFKRKVLAAGFPGSPASDGAFLSALYKFSQPEVPPEAPPQ